MLDQRTERYVTAFPLSQEGRHGGYFPDTVIGPLLDHAKKVTPRVASSANKDEPTFTLEESKSHILEALKVFDQNLYLKAKDIFDAGYDDAAKNSNNPSYAILWNKRAYLKNNHIRGQDDKSLNSMEEGKRWRIAKVPPGKAFMMRSTPAESPSSEFSPSNKHQSAVIDFHFDGTMNSVIYLAHEVGHAIADDYIREGGKVDQSGKPARYKFDANPQHMDETQAYFVQHIVNDHLNRHPNPQIAKAAKNHFSNTMGQYIATMNATSAEAINAGQNEQLHGRPTSILTALGLYNQAKGQDTQRRAQTTEALLGRQGPKNIAEVLDIAGVRNSSEMNTLAQTTINQCVGSKLESGMQYRPVKINTNNINL